jgi:hypothetical protein
MLWIFAVTIRLAKRFEQTFAFVMAQRIGADACCPRQLANPQKAVFAVLMIHAPIIESGTDSRVKYQIQSSSICTTTLKKISKEVQLLFKTLES